MSRTPNPPFIPPLPTTPDASPEHPPVIPMVIPNWNQSVPTGGGYVPYPSSPYSAHSPFVPNLSPMVTPGVMPGMFSPQQQPKVNRLGVTEDFTGYPPGSGPPMLSSNQPSSFYGSHSNSPQHSQSAPPIFQNFRTPWDSTASQHPPTPLTGFTPIGNHDPPPPVTGPPPRMGNIPPPQISPSSSSLLAYVSHSLPRAPVSPNTGTTNAKQRLLTSLSSPVQLLPTHSSLFSGNSRIPSQMNGQGPSWQGGGAARHPPFYGPDLGPWGEQKLGQRPFRAPPEPLSQIFDCMDPFTEGKDYGAVLDPFLVRVLKPDMKLNPLISPLPEDGSDRINLNWNMLFPTSTVQCSADPSHISWSKGRNAPATFPRISSLRIVSNTMPWVLNVEAGDADLGVTCGEVIDSIGLQLLKFSDKHDYELLTPSLRQELCLAYRRNRSREPGVPGGQLGQGLKRLDFLRQDTMFAGIEVNDSVVKRVCGDVLPCVFVLKCSKIFPVTRQEVEDREARMRANGSSRPRSGASSNIQIDIHPPSTTGSESDEDNLHPWNPAVFTVDLPQFLSPVIRPAPHLASSRRLYSPDTTPRSEPEVNSENEILVRTNKKPPHTGGVAEPLCLPANRPPPPENVPFASPGPDIPLGNVAANQTQHLESLLDSVLATVVIIQAATSTSVTLSAHAQQALIVLNQLVAYVPPATTCSACSCVTDKTRTTQPSCSEVTNQSPVMHPAEPAEPLPAEPLPEGILLRPNAPTISKPHARHSPNNRLVVRFPGHPIPPISTSLEHYISELNSEIAYQHRKIRGHRTIVPQVAGATITKAGNLVLHTSAPSTAHQLREFRDAIIANTWLIPNFEPLPDCQPELELDGPWSGYVLHNIPATALLEAVTRASGEEGSIFDVLEKQVGVPREDIRDVRVLCRDHMLEGRDRLSLRIMMEDPATGATGAHMWQRGVFLFGIHCRVSRYRPRRKLKIHRQPAWRLNSAR